MKAEKIVGSSPLWMYTFACGTMQTIRSLCSDHRRICRYPNHTFPQNAVTNPMCATWEEDNKYTELSNWKVLTFQLLNSPVPLFYNSIVKLTQTPFKLQLPSCGPYGHELFSYIAHSHGWPLCHSFPSDQSFCPAVTHKRNDPAWLSKIPLYFSPVAVMRLSSRININVVLFTYALFCGAGT